MIRWKQAEVHRKRRERQDKIDALQMESKLNQRILNAFHRLRSLSDNFTKPFPATLLATTVIALCKEISDWDAALAQQVMEHAHRERGLCV